MDFLRPLLGLTETPSAVAPVPEANIRKPSFLMLIAALVSLSCLVLQELQTQERISNVLLPTTFRQIWQVLLEGKNLLTSRYTLPAADALYLSIVQNIPHPT